MRKVIILNNLELTKAKKNVLNTFKEEYLMALRNTCIQLPFADTTVQLHHLSYANIRQMTNLPSDIVQEARKDIWKFRSVLEERNYCGDVRFRKCTIRLNKRWFKYVTTNRNTPAFKITYSKGKTFVIPIAKDNQFERFESFTKDEWIFNNISLLHDGRISVVLEKEFDEIEPTQRYVVGIDICSSTLSAVSIFDTKTSKVVKQLYFGRDIAKRQRKYIKHRAKLRSLADIGSKPALKSLKKIGIKQRNFVKTRSGQIAKEIIQLAQKYKGYIAIEKLNISRVRKSKMNKKGRSKTNRIPYAQLISFLKSNGNIYHIPVVEVDPYHTSKWCPHCGAINKGHYSKNYALYKCKCGLVINSDRKASLCVGVKSVVERMSHKLTGFDSIQISTTQVRVNGLLRPQDANLNKATV